MVPYLAFARKDRQTKPFDPLTLRYAAQLFESVGTSQVIVLEAHNVAAFQNAFRCVTTHIEAHLAFDRVARDIVGDEPVVAIDWGGAHVWAAPA